MFFDVEHLIQQACSHTSPALSQNRKTVDAVLSTSSTCISFTYFPIAEWRCTSEHALVQMTARVSDVIWVAQITFKFVDINGCLASFPIFLLV